MSRIRSKDTKPEEIVRKYLFSQGFRYRKNDPRYPGKPDIVLPKYRTVVLLTDASGINTRGVNISSGLKATKNSGRKRSAPI